jgi:hypothetical protein
MEKWRIYDIFKCPFPENPNGENSLIPESLGQLPGIVYHGTALGRYKNIKETGLKPAIYGPGHWLGSASVSAYNAQHYGVSTAYNATYALYVALKTAAYTGEKPIVIEINWAGLSPTYFDSREIDFWEIPPANITGLVEF